MTLRLFVVLTLFATGASAQECQSSLRFEDLKAAMGGDLRIQPVHSPDGFRGWRFYNTQTSAQLTALGIGTGALMTQVCGVAAKEIVAGDYRICCNVDTLSGIEVTFKIADQDAKFLIKRT
jgi:hypothetical protein